MAAWPTEAERTQAFRAKAAIVQREGSFAESGGRDRWGGATMVMTVLRRAQLVTFVGLRLDRPTESINRIRRALS